MGGTLCEKVAPADAQQLAVMGGAIEATDMEAAVIYPP